MRINKYRIFALLAILPLILISCNEDADGVTIHAQEEDDDSSNFTPPSDQKATNDKTLISNEEIDEDGYKKNNKTIIRPDGFSKSTDSKEVNLPQAQVLLPIRRRDTSHSELNNYPCGGVTKKKANTLTTMGGNIDVVWEVFNPVSGGNCTVKLSPGLETASNFITLQPADISLDRNGQFACGRVKGFESHQFKLPQDYVCDQCTLQWAWNTPQGTLYSCSDIIINGNKIEDCLAKCQNGGACFNGKCLCTENFTGDFCQTNSKIKILK